MNKPVTELLRNQSLDDFMTEVVKLRNEMNSIGSNLNQAVKKLPILSRIAEFKSWIIYFETEEKKCKTRSVK